MTGIRYCKQLAAIILALCCILLSFSGTSFALATGSDLGSITLSCKTENRILSGMQWDLFLVAERNENYYELMTKYEQQYRASDGAGVTKEQPNVYHTVGQFRDIPVMLNDTSTSAMSSAASTLENEAVVRRYTPDRTAVSDANGIVIFDDVPQGLYLLSGKRLKIGDYAVLPSPMLVEVIHDNVHDNLYIDSIPKIQLRTLSEGDSKHTVRKIWKKDADFVAERGTYLKVNVFKNGELFDTATLNEENNWEMTWYGEADAEWRVAEVDIPKKYTVVYLANETQYMLENTYTPTYNSSSSNEDWDDDFPSPTETVVTETTVTTAASTPIMTTTDRDGSQITDTMTTTNRDGSQITDTMTTTNRGGSHTTDRMSTTRRDSSTTTITLTTTAPPAPPTPPDGGGSGGGGGGGGSGGGGSVEKLPQTGQLWWPVPILGLFGILFIVTGWRVLRREERQ